MARRSSRFPCSGGTEYLQSHESSGAEQRTAQELRGPYSLSKHPKYTDFQLPNYRNENRIWRDEVLDGLRTGSLHRNASESVSFIHPLTRRVLNTYHEPRLRNTLNAALLHNVINEMKGKEDGARAPGTAWLGQDKGRTGWDRTREGRKTRVECIRHPETWPLPTAEPTFRFPPAALITQNSSTHVISTSQTLLFIKRPKSHVRLCKTSAKLLNYILKLRGSLF